MTTNSPWDGGDRDVLFAAIALVGAWDLAGVAIDLLARSSAVLAHPDAPRWLLALADAPGLVVVLGLVGLVGLALVATRRTRVLGLAIALAMSLVLGEALAAATEGPWRARFFVGAALFGALFGELWARWAGAGASTRARAAEAGALGMLAATWFGAGLSKLGGAGLDWADSTTLRAITLAHAHVDAPGLAAIVATSPMLARALAIATVLVQMSAPALLCGPRARLVGASSLVAFHLGVAAITRIGYWQPVALLLVFALPWPRWIARWRAVEPDEPPIPACPRATSRIVVAAVAVVVIAWLPGVRAYTAGHHRPRMGDGGPVVARTAERSLGPLAVGDELPGAWRIDAIEREDDRAAVVLAHASHGRVVLWVSARTQAQAPSPFDGETVAVAYADAAAPVAAFAPAAHAIAERLDAAPPKW